jgi:hypothetical protein
VVHRGEHGRFERPPLPPPSAPHSTGAAYPIAPRLVVPSSGQLRTFTGGRH